MNVQDLFVPAPSGVGPDGNIPLVPDPSTWFGRMLALAGQVGLPTTAWQPGQPERTIFAIEAVNFNLADVDVSLMAQGGFLQSAAFGTVTYTDVDGTVITLAVTPDPSDAAANPTGRLGWLDALAQSVYNTPRLAASAASGPIAISKITSGSAGPYSAGAYHVANAQTGATYTNTSSVTVASGIIGGSGGVVSSVVPGLTSTFITTVGSHGFSVGDSIFIAAPTTTGINGLANVFGIVTSVSGSNTLTVSVGSSGTYVSGGTLYTCTVTNMRADLVGPAGSAAPGQVSTAITQNAGVFLSNVLPWSGANWESNAKLVDRCVLSLAARSPNGPSQAYTYFAESAVALLAEQVPPYVLTNGPVQATTHSTPLTGIVNVIVASESPLSNILGANVTPGVSQLGISSVTQANPAVVTCAAPTSLTAGQSMTVVISGALGMPDINGTWTGTYTGTNSFSIPLDTTASSAYTGGGTVEGGDLGQIDALIQSNVVPDNTTAITASAVALPIQVVAVVVVPQAYVQAYKARVLSQLQTQIRNYEVGGNAPGFTVEYNDIVGALEEAGVQVLGQASVVREVQSLSLNGGGVNEGVPFPSPFYQAILLPPLVTVVGI